MRGGRTEVYTIGSVEGMLGIADVTTSEVVPNPARGQISGWPKPANPTRDAWNYDGTYIAQPGDTFSGIARTYLGQYTLFRDIWYAQSEAFRNDPQRVAKAKSTGRYPVDILFVGDVLNMPPAAQAEARRIGVLVPAPVASSSGSSAPVPVVLPTGEVVMPEMTITERKPKNPALALSSILGGGLIFMWKHPSLPRIAAWWHSLRGHA